MSYKLGLETWRASVWGCEKGKDCRQVDGERKYSKFDLVLYWANFLNKRQHHLWIA